MTTKLPEVDVANLTKIPAADLHLLWVNDWNDGPLEAVVEHRGAACLMVLLAEDEDDGNGHPERWLIVELSETARADEERWHALFVEHVGDHWCFHGPALTHPEPSGDPDPEKFYAPYHGRPPLDLSKSTVLGWADEMPAR